MRVILMLAVIASLTGCEWDSHNGDKAMTVPGVRIERAIELCAHDLGGGCISSDQHRVICSNGSIRILELP